MKGRAKIEGYPSLARLQRRFLKKVVQREPSSYSDIERGRFAGSSRLPPGSSRSAKVGTREKATRQRYATEDWVHNVSGMGHPTSAEFLDVSSQLIGARGIEEALSKVLFNSTCGRAKIRQEPQLSINVYKRWMQYNITIANRYQGPTSIGEFVTHITAATLMR
ncbi:hypothetical protein BDN72DRAFT_857691 [Pluteus cervinus]|uniref:Uncharacterized protein n=1 Tax=Pluteus cervinus TaxID=181527 RepID=A0ACD3AVK4_9AGAR|nr:hypothetical protein BDN72DRAFT_857691 [Pluteus cervinus]